MRNSGPIRIACLDDDHVMTLIRTGLADWTAEDERWLAAFFAPEPFDTATLASLGHGLRAADGVTVTNAHGDPAAIADANIILLRRGSVDAAMIAACPDLRLVQRLGARTDGIDLQALRDRGVPVSCLARRSLAVTAEHAILLMLALGKRLPEAERQLRAGQYGPAVVNPTKVAYNWIGLSNVTGLNGRVLGIVGLGEVGAMVARLAVAFGMRVIYANRKPMPTEREASLDVAFRPLQDLMAEADFISIHAPNTPQTRHLVGAAEIGRMHLDAFLVNTSRGALVDEDALYSALQKGLIAGAGLDVHETEPREAADRFCALSNVILTPHLAGGSRKGLLVEVASIYDNFRCVLAGDPPPHDRVA
jgi:phosphoglycerate dehydrogenase-like enzyme